MIWLFKVDDVFWNNTPKVNECYIFDINDIEFDLTQYDISLYFGTAAYYLLSTSNDKDIYLLNMVGVNKNPSRTLISVDFQFYDIVRNFYIDKQKFNTII